MDLSQPITSRDNQYLKLARRVRDRKEPDLIFVEGKRLCLEAASSGLTIEHVFVSDKFSGRKLDTLINDQKVNSHAVSDDLFASIADTGSPQGIVLIARRPPDKTIEDLFEMDTQATLPIWICLERPNNPSNLGAVIRTAEAANIRGILVTSDSADPFAPKSLRASMGSAFRFAIAVCPSVTEVLQTAGKKGIVTAAMDAGGNLNYLDLDWTRPTLLIAGAEAEGLSAAAADSADHKIRIDMKNTVESLNLAVSVGIVVFEGARQNRLANGRI